MAASKGEDKMLNIQKSLKENQQDLSDFLSDLDKWTDNVKKKDEDLRKGKVVEEPKLPPVRNSLLKKKKKKKPKDQTSETSNGTENLKNKKISGYDFRAWDKLDVDKMCEDIDKEEEKKKKSDSSEYETDEEWEEERRKKQAAVEKDRGNQCFKENDYVGAIECYTRGMSLDPTNPILPANRAMAMLKQEKFAAAETDCLTALALDPLYIKAHLRLGTARCGLKKYIDAKEVFEKVLLLEPQNKQAKMEIERIEKELTKQKMVSQVQPSVDPDAGLVKPISKPDHMKSQKSLRRLEIEEVGLDDDFGRKSAIEKVTETQSAVKRNITARDNEMFDRFTSGQRGKSVPQKLEKKITVQESSDEHTKLVSSDIVDDKQSTRLDLLEVRNTENKSKISPRNEEKDTESLSPRNFSVPQTSFQFQSDYKTLKNKMDSFYEYLKNINPCNYPQLFGNLLDAEILMKMLTVLKDFFVPEGQNIYPHLQYLADVKRFSMTVMFFSRKEQQVIKDLFSHLQTCGNVSSDDVNKLAKKYQIS